MTCSAVQESRSLGKVGLVLAPKQITVSSRGTEHQRTEPAQDPASSSSETGLNSTGISATQSGSTSPAYNRRTCGGASLYRHSLMIRATFWGEHD